MLGTNQPCSVNKLQFKTCHNVTFTIDNFNEIEYYFTSTKYYNLV